MAAVGKNAAVGTSAAVGMGAAVGTSFAAPLSRLSLPESEARLPWSIAPAGTDGTALAEQPAVRAPRLRVAEPVSQLLQAALEGWGGADAWWVRADQRHVRPVAVARVGVPLIPYTRGGPWRSLE